MIHAVFSTFLMLTFAYAGHAMPIKPDANRDDISNSTTIGVVHGRHLSTRSWSTIRSECDIAGGSFTPRVGNCNTFFGSSRPTCEATSGCHWSRQYNECPRQRRDLICQVGCSCSKNWWTGVCTCSGRYETGSHCAGTFTGPAADGTCTKGTLANGARTTSAVDCVSGVMAGRLGLYYCTASSQADRQVGHGCDALKDCPPDLMCSIGQQCQAKLENGAGCLTAAQCASGRCAAPVLSPTNRQCSSGGRGDICDPGNPCASGLKCFLGGFCGTAGDSEGAPCDARVPCAAGWQCNGRFQCTRRDGKLNSACDAFSPCSEGTCSLGSKCLRPGTFVGAECDITVPCAAGFTCGASGTCERDDDWVRNSMVGIPRNYRPQCTLSQETTVATNYMANERFSPDRVVAPATVEQVVSLVQAATPARPLKAAGGCAGMSPGTATDGTLIHTYAMNQIEVFDEPQRLFWLGTGVSINDAVHYFFSRSPKLAMPNLGGWTGQTVVGAVSTGTHGSGVGFAPLCDFVRAIHIVAGDGRQYIFEPKTNARLRASDYSGLTLIQDDAQFHSSVVAMGTLGVTVRILYEAVPYYWLAQTRQILPWSELKPNLDSVIAENDHVELWINPYDESVLVSARNRISASEFVATSGESIDVGAVAGKHDEFRTIRGFRAAWEVGMSAAGTAIQEARTEDRAGCAATANVAACSCKASYLASHDGQPPPAGFPHADTCVSQLLTAALEGEQEFTNVVMDYPYVFSTGRANSAKVLCSEANVPIEDARELVDEWIVYANSLASANGAAKNYYTAFGSVRFSGKSDHFMASSYGGARAYIEAPVVQGGGYFPGQQNADQVQLIDGWNEHIMRVNPRARLHFGLQNDKGWDVTTIRERYPAEAWDMLASMEATYDPNDITRSAFEDRILGKGAHALAKRPPKLSQLPPPPPPPSPAPPPLPGLCSDSCHYARDHDCDDGGPGSEYQACSLGSDCFDCGNRAP